MLALSPLIIQLIQAGITLAPELIAAWQKEVDLANAGQTPTDAERAQIDAGLDTANAALQAAQPAG